MVEALMYFISLAYTYGIYLFIGFMFVFIIGFHVYESISEHRKKTLD